MVNTLLALPGRVLRVMVGLGAAAVVLTLGLAAAAGLLLRLAWQRSHTSRILPARTRRTNSSRGEVIDVEVREIPAR
ncbi:MAG: hypothetical protein AB1430_07365 [Pseudomonadota bacterium]